MVTQELGIWHLKTWKCKFPLGCPIPPSTPILGQTIDVCIMLNESSVCDDIPAEPVTTLITAAKETSRQLQWTV